MPQVQIQYLPPHYWQDFQNMAVFAAKREWPNGTVEGYGREGQEQRGIDVLVSETGKAPIGVQAKKRRLADAEGRLDLTGGLTTKEIDKMVKKAEEFEPAIRRLVIATTALSDTKLVDHAAKISARRAKKKKFMVEIWFWDYFDGMVNWNSDMQEIYFRDVAPRIFAADPKKRYFLLVRTAFNRSAFTTRLESEDSGDDMEKALAGTRRAITLGELLDREDRRLARAPIGLEDIDGAARTSLDECVSLLDRARHSYRDGILSKALRYQGRSVRPAPPNGLQVVREVDRLRGEAIDKVNEAIATVGLAPLNNHLFVR